MSVSVESGNKSGKKPLNADLNPRRIERYLTTIWDSGARPVIILSKADLSSDTDAAVDTVADVAFSVPILALSAATGQGLDRLDEYLKPGQTVALVGSSGVGKSTLVNRLLGYDVQKVLDIREDDARGRHATTARRMFMLPGRGMLIAATAFSRPSTISRRSLRNAAFAIAAIRRSRDALSLQHWNRMS